MPKTINGAVGRGGRNFPDRDVLTVQYLLNCVPARNGGPQPELVMDGICGPKTIKAIEEFQRKNLGFADGRVDPGGKTLQALQQYDPAPNQALAVAVTSKGWQCKDYGKAPAKSSGVPGGKQGPGVWPGGKMGGGNPFSKLGPGGKFGQDPFGKTGGKWGPGGKFG